MNATNHPHGSETTAPPHSHTERISLTVPAQPARTSDNYLPVIAIYPNGAEVRTSTLKGREHHMEKAIEELSAGRHASVPLDEAERVRTWLLNHNANL